jgi:predicted nucleic acid-binding protein
MVDIKETHINICRDKDDNNIIKTAVAAKANTKT